MPRLEQRIEFFDVILFTTAILVCCYLGIEEKIKNIIVRRKVR